RYLAALLRDLQVEAERASGRTLISVFLGGGTPSLFTAQEIASLLNGVSKHFSVAEDVEVTMEANPGTVESGDPRDYRAAGVNRLSIGAQSFSAASLQTLGRIHSVADIYRAVSEARAAGIDNINLDIMYALPGQDVSAAIDDLKQALQQQPAHLSWYQLTLEPNTVFHARPPAGLPDNDLCCDIQQQGQSLLAASGYQQYEISAYAGDGRRCRHNLNYWTFGDYLAVGAGAHGKISCGDGIWRYAKPAHPLQYMEAVESGRLNTELAPLGAPERVFEFMLNALRLTGGFALRLFEERTGLATALLDGQLATLREKRLIEEPDSGYWRVTALGQRFLNDVQAEFLP
ncbi:MAG: radical SAM family heme chaperone HemW, partial [Gammaproteobacteria bacterium]|nr:radical SAM family heme chaperone HemW [Gammaproteobacteria bacterium]